MTTRTGAPTGSGGEDEKKPAPRRRAAAAKPAVTPAPAARVSRARNQPKSPSRLEREANPKGRSTPALGRGKSKTQRVIDAAERASKAMRLRANRASWDSIAKQCGYSSRGAAYTAVQRELKRLPREAAKELRVSELEMLDMAQRAISVKIAAGNFGAIDRLLRIMDARAKLTGLHDDIADTGVDEVKDVLAAWMGQVRKQVERDELEDAIDDELEGDDDAADEA